MSFQNLFATAEPHGGADAWHLPLGDRQLTVRPWQDGVLMLAFAGDAPLPASPAALPADPALGLTVSAHDGGYTVAAPGVRLVIALAPLAFSLESADGTPLWGPVYPGVREGRLALLGPLEAEDAFYGLGEKPGYLDKRGRAYVMWNTDNTGPHVETHDALYQSIPWLITSRNGRASGFLFDDPGKARFDLGAREVDVWGYEADGPGLRLFAAAGPSLDALVRRYAALTGKMPMPPRWALGYHQSRWSYPSAREVLAIASEFRQREIPCDVIHLDIDYMDGYRVFTWNPERFPDPKGLTAQLAAWGMHAVTIVDPGVKQDPGYPIYDECAARGYHVRQPNGSPFVGPVWPGDCLFPDFDQPEARAWWGRQHQALLDAGVAGIWNDMNEPSVFRGPAVAREDQTMPDGVIHGDGVPHRRAHNIYGLHMSQATREGLLALRPNERPFVISRAGFAGIQRYAMVWTGDNHSIWAHLEQGIPMCLNLGLSGVPFVGPDVGGFMGDSAPELLVRWTQLGAFTPFFRNHCATGQRAQEPWAFGPEVEQLCRAAIARRYRIMPYLYTAFHAAAETGLPVMRALGLAFPDDPACARLFDQFMLGDDLLVAPVTKPGATHRMVYFPAGAWIALDSGETIAERGYRVVEAPLARIPVFVRAGAVLPLGPIVPSTATPIETVTLHVAPGETLAGTWYDDDGHSLDFTRGAFSLWRFSGHWDARGFRLELARPHGAYVGTVRRFEVSLPADRAPEALRFNGEPVSVRREGDRLVVTVPCEPGVLV